MTDVVCLGELLIDFVPTQSGTDLVSAPGFVKAPGGAPANVAVGLARLGASSAFMGMVGDDPFGRFLAHTLEVEGVDVASLRFNQVARTALAFVSLRADGEREFMFYRHPSADMLYAPEDVDTDAVRGARCLHFGSISLITASSRAATWRALDEAQSCDCLVSYDPNLRLPLWPDAETAKARMLEGVRRAHVMKLSDEELEFLTGSADVEGAARTLWHGAMRLIVVTQGAAGCTYVTSAHTGSVKGFAVDAVDTTGAGDAFVAALLRALLGKDERLEEGLLEDETRLRDACRRANAAGALTATARGAIPALPRQGELDEWVAARPG
ncbi:MAG: PfkB family carbohydrate kinase [Gammaproteobacteria bacterium]